MATVSTSPEVITNNNSASDVTNITQLADLTIAKSHMGNFAQGQQGAQFSLVVTNGGFAATTGVVTVTDTLPSGLTFVSGSGSGFACSANLQVVTCTNSVSMTQIAVNGMATITLNVNVAPVAPATLSNTAGVACSCAESTTDNNTSNTDMVTVTQLADLTISKSHTGNFNQGQQGAQFALLVTNAGGAATGAGTVSVTDTLPSGLTFVSGTGTGWSCMANGQAVSCTQANTISGNGNSTLTLNVNVAGDAP